MHLNLLGSLTLYAKGIFMVKSDAKEANLHNKIRIQSSDIGEVSIRRKSHTGLEYLEVSL